MSALLELRDVALVRGGRLLFEGVELTLAPGGAAVITGPNGVGTSSLRRLAAGLRSTGALSGLLMLPLAVPILIFGAGMIEQGGETGALKLLGALSLLLVAAAPFAAGAAIRASRD